MRFAEPQPIFWKDSARREQKQTNGSMPCMLQTKIPEPFTTGYKKNTRPNKFARSFSPTSNYLALLRFCCRRGGKESDTE
ncbi:MAG: hypothetical protein K2N04_05805, partial [Alistipes sp.]|nr:hypothetical protein [Alistipes sp.]